MDTIKSMRWVDFFLYAITDPGALYRQIQKNEPRPLVLSFAVPVFAALTGIIAGSLVGVESRFFYSKLTYGWLLSVVSSLFTIVAAAALMDAFAQFLGYRGNMKEMMALVNFSQLPKIFVLPLVLIFRTIHFAPPFFYVLFSVLVALWSAFIVVKGIAEMHDSGAGRAVIIFLFPYLLAGVTVFLMLVLGVLYLVRYVSG
ncbi:MAG: YIP1 family protein [Spirochaetes bacterium]|nr:YIP1 family protein [Spirochaetota bacterium]